MFTHPHGCPIDHLVWVVYAHELVPLVVDLGPVAIVVALLSLSMQTDFVVHDCYGLKSVEGQHKSSFSIYVIAAKIMNVPKTYIFMVELLSSGRILIFASSILRATANC